MNAFSSKFFDFSSFGENTFAITDNGKQYKYMELFEQERLLAEQLSSRRSLVFILCTNTVGSILGYVSCMDYGHVAVLVDASLDSSLLNTLLETYSPNYIWVPDKQEKQFNGPKSYSAWEYSLIEYEN